MGLQINPDRGDSITIEDLGASWRVHFFFRQDDGPKTEFEARFPRDFNELNPDEVESYMMGMAVQVARNTGVITD